MRYIKDLKSGDNVSEIYLCKNKQAMKSKAGKTYYSLSLQDKTGILDAKIWDLTPGIEHFESMDYIKVDGQVTTFQNSPQLNVRRVRRASEGEYYPADYIPCSKYDVEEMYKELLSYIDSVSEPHLHELLEMYFVKSQNFIKTFKTHSAAKSIHHSFSGGLLEHTLSVTKLCDFYCTRYPALNRDLLITAAICHDIGKTRELSGFPANEYTDEGQLVGHIVTGTMMVRDAILRIPHFPKTLANELEHCIVSHHGELEYGSPKKPAILEAMALHLADLTDARMETMTEVLEDTQSETEWLGFNRFLDSNIRKTTV